MYYWNTSMVASAPTNEVWQHTSVTPTKMSNGSIIDVTRNYTYTVGKTMANDDAATQRPLLRFQWTQSIPMEPALPVHRDCFIFDYTTDYVAGAIDGKFFEAPRGITCSHRERSP